MARNRKKDEQGESVPRLAPEGELTIYVAAELKPRIAALLDEIGEAGRGEIDLSRVSEIDSAGLQLLLLSVREAARRGIALELRGHSEAVRDCLALCNLGAELGADDLAA